MAVTTDGETELARRVAAALGLDSTYVVNDLATVGAGQVARCHRIVYDSHDRRITVVVKSPSTDETSRATATGGRLYLRETSFYRELQPDVDIRTPDPLHVEYDPTSDDFMIVLEDLTPARSADQFTGLSREDAELALSELAGLHAPTAARGDLHERDWLRGIAQETLKLYETIVPTLAQQFIERYDEVLVDRTRRVIERLGAELAGYADLEPAVPVVVHGDYRADNMIFGGRSGEVPLAIVDWQTIMVASPMLDVAYFIATSLSPADRMQYEDDLINLYLEQMSRRGVELDAQVARREYARYTLHPVVMLVVAAIVVERTERGDRMFLTMIDRAVEAVEQWDAFGEIARC